VASIIELSTVDSKDCIGDPIKEEEGRKYYDGFSHNGVNYKINDYAYVIPPTSAPKRAAIIGQIMTLYETPQLEKRSECKWLYRPQGLEWHVHF
jgi:hypothetical protein